MDDVASNSWKKIQDKALKEGFRDGISDGRKINFQKSFDEGYKLGFEAGFKLGYYKGHLMTSSSNIPDEVLQKSTRGNCEMCTKENLDRETVFNLNQLQSESNKKIINTLQEKYSYISH